ncbi:MAG: hypothetical protein EP330_26405 [Deltaproteobacteria bacterium]|nr:MAG: hypothetical protein EP330_26405 [Deltaproteobacteria bacterium]
MFVGFEPAVLTWWGGLSAVAVINLLLLAWSAKVVLGTEAPTAEIDQYRRWQLFFGGLYVIGCASRSFILRSDGRRYSMIDHVISSVFVGRTTATIAEMAFVAQWAVLLYALSKRDEDVVGQRLAQSLVPIIAVAETASWMGILSTNPLFHAVEESLWTITAALFMVGLARRLATAGPALKRFLWAALASGVLYLAYMVTEDVPTYWFRWQQMTADGVQFMSFGEGLADSVTWQVKKTWADWEREVVWQSLYFSFAVWMSLVLIHRPLFPEERRA